MQNKEKEGRRFDTIFQRIQSGDPMSKCESAEKSLKVRCAAISNQWAPRYDFSTSLRNHTSTSSVHRSVTGAHRSVTVE